MALIRRKNCRLCDGPRLELALPIAASPIADAYVSTERLGEKPETYPLDLYLCLDCGHVQNVDVVDPEILFRDYIYVTSSSRGLVEHYRGYADEVMARFAVKSGSLAVEIGSNDGSLLQFFKNKGLKVLGIDPARRIAEEASAKGVMTLPEFFSQKLAHGIRAQYGPAAVLAANNVFAHADNLADIVRGIRALLADDGVFVFEVSYLVDVQQISSKGGSIRGFAQRLPEGKRPVAPIIGELLGIEARRGFMELEVYREFGEAIELRKAALIRVVDEVRAAGKRIAGYGASTTVTTLIWHFALTDQLEFLADDNPRKHGLFSPGCHIPVLPSDELYARRPDYVIILAWNFSAPIIKRHRRFLDEGGKFVIPLPELRIV